MKHIILFLSHTLFMIFKGQHKNAQCKKILQKGHTYKISITRHISHIYDKTCYLIFYLFNVGNKKYS